MDMVGPLLLFGILTPGSFYQEYHQVNISIPEVKFSLYFPVDTETLMGNRSCPTGELYTQFNSTM